jgi:hypothetical protein
MGHGQGVVEETAVVPGVKSAIERRSGHDQGVVEESAVRVRSCESTRRFNGAATEAS